MHKNVEKQGEFNPIIYIMQQILFHNVEQPRYLENMNKMRTKSYPHPPKKAPGFRYESLGLAGFSQS